MTMGDRIRKLRKDADMTQEELGNCLGVGKSAIVKYEKGEVENITRKNILIMASKFNVSPEYIWAFNDDEKSNYLTDEMAKKYLTIKYGEDSFVFLEMFSRLTNKNKKKLMDLCEDIEKSEKYDSAKQMFK